MQAAHGTRHEAQFVSGAMIARWRPLSSSPVARCVTWSLQRGATKKACSRHSIDIARRSATPPQKSIRAAGISTNLIRGTSSVRRVHAPRGLHASPPNTFPGQREHDGRQADQRPQSGILSGPTSRHRSGMIKRRARLSAQPTRINTPPPSCPSCGREMRLVGIEAHGEESLQTFACDDCEEYQTKGVPNPKQ